MGNRSAKRSNGGPVGVDVNPLVVVSGIGKQIDLRLRDRDPFAAAYILPDAFGQG